MSRNGGRLPDPGPTAVCAGCGEPREMHGGAMQLGACPGRSGVRARRFQLQEGDKPPPVIDRPDGRRAPGSCGEPRCVEKRWHYDYDHVVPADDRSAYDVLHAEVVATLTLGMARGADVDELAADVVHELLEAGTDTRDRRAEVFVAIRTALKEAR